MHHGLNTPKNTPNPQQLRKNRRGQRDRCPPPPPQAPGAPPPTRSRLARIGSVTNSLFLGGTQFGSPAVRSHMANVLVCPPFLGV